MRYYPALLALFVLTAIKPVQAQTLQPNYGAPATPVSVCNGNVTFYVKIIGSLPSCATGTLGITLPPGYVYVSNSAFVSAGSGGVAQAGATGNQATLNLSGIPDSPDSTVISYQAYATCSAIGSSNNQVSYTLSTSCLPTGTVSSNTFNTQSAALNITTITNKNYNGIPGDVYTRSITITNNGLGKIGQINLADTSGAGLYVYNSSVSGGWGLGVVKTISGTDTVNTFSLSGPALSQGQSIVVTETVRVMSRCFLQTKFNAYFGCYGNACTANNVNSTSTAGATINVAFTNSIKTLPTLTALTCRGTPYTQTIGFTDTGTVAINNLWINIFNYNGLTNGYANFRYKTGINGSWSTLTPDSSKLMGAAQPCISGMPDTAWATIPVIKPGDTVYVAFEEQDCPLPGVTPSSTIVIAGLGLSYRYGDACGDSIPVTTSFLRNYQRTQMSVLANVPANMAQSTSYQFIYNFSLANSTTYTTSGAAGSKVRFSIAIPNNVDFTGAMSDVTLTSISTGLPIATPSYFNYNFGTHTIDVTYNIGSGFTVNLMQNSNLTISNLTLNCSAVYIGNALVMDCFMKTNTSCSNEEWLLSQTNTIAFICPVSCGTAGGLSFNGFTVRRVNYGLPDNNNDGVPDASGTLDMTKIRTNYTLPGDTLEVAYYGKISVGTGSPAAGFKYGYAVDSLVGTSVNKLTNLYAVAQLFSSGAATPFFTSSNLTIGGGTGTSRRVDISISKLQAAGLPITYTKFLDGDSLIVKFYYKAGNPSPLVNPISFTNNKFYLSDASTYPALAGHVWTCGSSYTGNCTLIGYSPSSHGSGNYTLTGGGTITITIDNYLTVGTGIAGSKPFIYEYRPISFYDSLLCNLPVGYSFVSASVTYSYTTGINTSTTKTVSVTPINPGADSLMFDVGELFETGVLPWGDQGSLITAKIVLAADCYPQAISHDSLYFNQLPTPGFNNAISPLTALPYAITSNAGTITFTPPVLTPTAVTTVASATDTASWDIQLDISSTTPANGVWMAKDSGPGGAAIFNIQQLSGPGGTVVRTIVPDAGGIYQLGAFTTTTSYYRVNASFTSCTKDSVQLAYGIICSTGSYPTSAATAGSKNDLYLTVVSQQPSLQISIVSQPTAPMNFCDTISYELEILDAGLGSARNLAVETTLPATGNIYYIPNTFQLQYPAGSGVYVNVPDAQVSISGNIVTFAIPAGLLPQLSSTQAYRIRFGVNTSCGFVSGGSLRFSPTGSAFCGQPANGIIQQGQQILIIGAPTTTNLYTLKSKVGIIARSCDTNGDVLVSYQFKIINQGPLATSISDGFSVELPAPWQLDTSTVVFTHNPGPPTPTGSAFTNVSGNTWYFNTGSGMIAGDSMQMTATLRIPQAQLAGLANGFSIPIVEQAIIRYVGYCSASGMPCPVSQIILNTKNTTTIYYSDSRTYYTNPPVLNVTDPAAVCVPLTVDLTAAPVTAGSTANLAFKYYSDAGALNPVAAPAAISGPGTFYITGTGISSGCGTDTLAVNVSFNNKPGIGISPDTLICAGGTASLTASSPASTIQWTNLPAGNTVMVTPTANSSYQAVATNAAGCKDTGMVNVNIVDFSGTLTASPNITMQGKTVVLETNNKYQVVAWLPQSQFPNQTSSTQSVVMGDSSQTFSVVVQSANGCSDTATVRVIIDPTSFNIYIPNAFTPNGDGRNDVFYVVGPGIKDLELRIFNQWGQQIYATRDRSRGWNGLFDGQQQPAGVYVYTVKAVLYNGTIITKKGTLLLIR